MPRSRTRTNKIENIKPKYINPSGLAPPVSNAYSHISRVKDFIFIAAQQGKDRSGNLVPLDDDGTKRIRQAYRNLKTAIESQGATLNDIVKMLIITPIPQYQVIANKIQRDEEFFGNNPIPPRTFILANLPDGDIFSIEAEVYFVSQSIITKMKENEAPSRVETDSHSVLRRLQQRKKQPMVSEYTDQDSNSESDSDSDTGEKDNNDTCKCTNELDHDDACQRRVITISSRELEKLMGKKMSDSRY